MSEMLMTQERLSKAEAMARALKRLETRILFIPVGPKYQLQDSARVLSPYWLVSMDYGVRQGGLFGLGAVYKEGSLRVIVDGKDGSAFLLEQSTEVALRQRGLEDRRLLPTRINEEVAGLKAVACARWKILLRLYRGIADLKVTDTSLFYRPAWRFRFGSPKGDAERIEPADGYEVTSESIRGLKADPLRP